MRAETTSRTSSLCPDRRASRSIAISGTIPDSPPTDRRRVGRPHEPAAYGTAYLEVVADDEFLVQEGRDFTPVKLLDSQLDLPCAIRWRRAHAVLSVTSANGTLVVYPVDDVAGTCVADGRGCAVASMVSTDTPPKATPSFDHVVTQ